MIKEYTERDGMDLRYVVAGIFVFFMLAIMLTVIYPVFIDFPNICHSHGAGDYDHFDQLTDGGAVITCVNETWDNTNNITITKTTKIKVN
jgi:hypothetical protein